MSDKCAACGKTADDPDCGYRHHPDPAVRDRERAIVRAAAAAKREADEPPRRWMRKPPPPSVSKSYAWFG